MTHLDNIFPPELVTGSGMLCEPEVDFTAKAVLVEEDEDEEEVEDPEEISAMSVPPSDTVITTNYEEAVKTEQFKPEDEKCVISSLVEVEESESEDEADSEEQPSAESEEFHPNVNHMSRHVVPISDDEVEEDLPKSPGDGNTDVTWRNA